MEDFGGISVGLGNGLTGLRDSEHKMYIVKVITMTLYTSNVFLVTPKLSEVIPFSWPHTTFVFPME